MDHEMLIINPENQIDLDSHLVYLNKSLLGDIQLGKRGKSRGKTPNSGHTHESILLSHEEKTTKKADAALYKKTKINRNI